jgi:ATP-dependent RNA helicase DeaD
MENLIFNDLDLSKEIQKAIDDMGFEEATPIQSQSIPHILEGRDVIGQAQTGTGKTCAFGIPAIERTSAEATTVQVLILCPTRELAIQMSEELKQVAKYKRGIRVLPVYGGQQIERQIDALKRKPQIIIGTPGRVMDHMRRGTLKLHDIKMMILDEADEMLNMGFREDIDIILEQIPEKRQTLLFSATMAKEIMDLTAKYQKSPVLVKAVHKELTVPNIEQYYIDVAEGGKIEMLSRLIDMKNIKLALVFSNTKKKVDEIAYHMQSRGYNAEALHGDMKQSFRDKVMNKFRKGQVEILIATDVAARGIDVDNVEAVFNYDIPNDEEYYVHRIGRTGRAGKNGQAFTFVAGKEFYKLKDIQRYTKSKIIPHKPPSATDIEEVKINNIFAKLKDILYAGNLTKYTTFIERLLAEDTSIDGTENFIATIDIAAGLLKMAIGPEVQQYASATEMDEFSDTGARNGMVRFFINIGNSLDITAKDILESITSSTNLTGKQIGKIDVYNKFSFIEVPREYAMEVLTSMKKGKIKGKRINIEKANKKG